MLPSVSNLLLCQYREAAEVLAKAFCNDPLLISILRGLDAEKRFSRLKLVFELTLKTLGPKRLPLAIKQGNQIYGVALVYPPRTYPPSFLSYFYILSNAVLRKGFYGLGRWLKWSRAIRKRHPPEPHYYLEFIGVDPPLQRQGIGSLMLKYIVGLTDREGMSGYLETANPNNLPFYQRFGFERIGEERIIGVPIWLMKRPSLPL